MTKVYVTVGISASGKSSWSKEMSSREGVEAVRFSSDDIRKLHPELTHSEVFSMMQEGVKHFVKEGISDEIYYDATNLNRRRRRGLYRNIKSWNKDAEVIVKFFSVPFETALYRNDKRDGSERVPDDVVLRMHRTLQVPRIGVDCDKIEVSGLPIFLPTERHTSAIESSLSTEDLLRNVSFRWISELSEVLEMKHDCAPHHLEDVETHIDMCIVNADTDEIRQIARFHDLGKCITKVMGDDGRASFRGHADVSAHYFLNYLALTKYKSKEIPKHEMDLVEVIYQHMNMHHELGKKNIRNNKLTDRIIKLGKEFAEVDDISRIRGEVE